MQHIITQKSLHWFKKSKKYFQIHNIPCLENWIQSYGLNVGDFRKILGKVFQTLLPLKPASLASTLLLDVRGAIAEVALLPDDPHGIVGVLLHLPLVVLVHFHLLLGVFAAGGDGFDLSIFPRKKAERVVLTSLIILQ